MDFIDKDQLIKTFGQTFFRPYLELFFPQIAARLILDDPALPVTFPNKEVYTDFPLGDRKYLDQVAQVWTREHNIEQVLLLNEWQESDDPIAPDPVDPQALGWLLRDKKQLPLATRLMLYTATLQLRHFPVPVVPVACWFCGGKGGFGKDRYDYHPVAGGLGVTFHRVCVPDLPAEEYVAMDNPVAYGLAVRMRRQRMSKVELAVACRKRIVHADLSPMEKALLWTFHSTYAKLEKDEEAQMQAIVDKPENQDVKEGEFSWASKIFIGIHKEAEQQGVLKGKLEEVRQKLLDICPVLGIRLTAARRQHLAQLDLDALESLWRHLLDHRAWPPSK